MDAPLAGVLVADLTQNVAGPTCTQILGDMGAELVKVERPGRGDDARAWAPPYWGDESATFMSVNRNKRSLSERAPSKSSGWAGSARSRSIRGSSTAPSPPSAPKGRSPIVPATTR